MRVSGVVCVLRRKGGGCLHGPAVFGDEAAGPRGRKRPSSVGGIKARRLKDDETRVEVICVFAQCPVGAISDSRCELLSESDAAVSGVVDTSGRAEINRHLCPKGSVIAEEFCCCPVGHLNLLILSSHSETELPLDLDAKGTGLVDGVEVIVRDHHAASAGIRAPGPVREGEVCGRSVEPDL